VFPAPCTRRHPMSAARITLRSITGVRRTLRRNNRCLQIWLPIRKLSQLECNLKPSMPNSTMRTQVHHVPTSTPLLSGLVWWERKRHSLEQEGSLDRKHALAPIKTLPQTLRVCPNIWTSRFIEFYLLMGINMVGNLRIGDKWLNQAFELYMKLVTRKMG